MTNVLWLVSLKARVLAGSPLAMDGSEFMFGECATFSSSELDVRRQVLAGLEKIKFELVEISHISPIEEAKWISESQDSEDILELIEDVKSSGEFSFGIFRSSEYLGMDE